MKNILYWFVCMIIIGTMLYLSISFINNEFNIREWVREMRASFIAIMWVFGLVGGILVFFNIIFK